MIYALIPMRQLALALPTRKKAGRKPTGKRRDPRHRPRPDVDPRHPVHVVLRVAKGLPRLRRRKAFEAIRASLRKIAIEGFHVVHTSIQQNHLHFLVEADGRVALSKGMQALGISLAKRINRAWGRAHGKVFAYRFHATPIENPTQARNALAYVLNNWRKHREDRTGVARTAQLDPYASGPAFDGWQEPWSWYDNLDPLPSCAPQTWLLRVGWRRGGPLISVRAVPSNAPI